MEERDGREAHMLVEGNARHANTYNNYNYKVKTDETIMFTKHNIQNNKLTIQKTIENKSQQ